MLLFNEGSLSLFKSAAESDPNLVSTARFARIEPIGPIHLENPYPISNKSGKNRDHIQLAGDAGLPEDEIQRAVRRERIPLRGDYGFYEYNGRRDTLEIYGASDTLRSGGLAIEREITGNITRRFVGDPVKIAVYNDDF